MQSYFPRPVVDIVATNGGHGYVSAMTTCKCGVQQDGSPIAQLLDYCKKTKSRALHFIFKNPGTFVCDGTRKRQVPGKPNSVSRFNKNTTFANRVLKWKQGKPQPSFGSVYTAKTTADAELHARMAFASPVSVGNDRARQISGRMFMLLSYNNANCRLDKAGHIAGVMGLEETGGTCKQLPALGTAFEVSETTGFVERRSTLVFTRLPLVNTIRCAWWMVANCCCNWAVAK